jgi:flagellar M-ring protein FliF
MLKLRLAHLPDKSDAAIRQLVAGAVDQLKPENVVVIDADTHQALGGALGGGRENEDESLDAELAKRVIATLEPVVGPDGVRASVHVERDLTSGEETQETYDPNSAVALNSTRTEEHMGSDSLGGVPGTSSNLPNARPAPALKSDPQSHTTKTESGTYAVNKTVRHTVQPAGRIRRMAAAVVVDDAVDTEMRNGQRLVTRRKRTAEEMKQIEELARATLGLDSARGDLLAIENLSFQNVQPEPPAPPTKVERLQRTLRNFTWLLRYAALACLFSSVYVLLLRPVKKQIVAAFKALPERVALAKLARGGQAEQGKLADAEMLQSILGAGTEGDPNITRLSSLKKHLVEKVKTEPAGATRLIQNWLHEGGVE